MRLRSQTAIQDPHRQPELSNVFAILGGRGTGKSTVLKRLYQNWEESDQGRTLCHSAPNQSNPRLYLVLQPLDCSVLPGDLAPGAAVLLWLKKELVRFLEEEKHQTGESGTKKGAQEKLMAKLDGLVGSYTRTGKDYRDLSLELSSSPNDYARYVIEGLDKRFDLSNDLRDWLNQALNELLPSYNYKAVVILLDDFDLVPATEVRRWQQALLDELHQDRLLFVLSADFYRLEHLGWDAKEQFDDKTGRALVDKLLPVQNRIELPEWSLEARKDFIPRRMPKDTEKPDAKSSEKRQERKKLWDLVQLAVESWSDLELLIAALFPPPPPGA